MTTRIGPWTRGEIPFPLVYQFTDENDEVIPLLSYTGKFVLQKNGGDGEQRDVIVDTDADTVTWVPEEADYAEEASFAGQFWVGNGTNRLASTDYEWDVEPPVADLVPDI